MFLGGYVLFRDGQRIFVRLASSSVLLCCTSSGFLLGSFSVSPGISSKHMKTLTVRVKARDEAGSGFRV